MSRLNHSSSLSFVSTLGVFATLFFSTCIVTSNVEEGGEDSSKDESTGTSSDSNGDQDEYVIRGGSTVRKADLTHASIVRQREQEDPMECPFPPDSPPCTDEACKMDHQSPDCESIINQYCS